MSENKLNYCSFCGNHKDSVTKLIVGEGVTICSDCIDLCNNLINEESDSDSNKNVMDFHPETIKAFLDEHVIGQNSAKMVLTRLQFLRNF
jgi:ATP-dependent Clp protease ATP-binding subunit ClpX